MSRALLGFFLLAGALLLNAAEYRGVMVKQEKALAFITAEGVVYPLKPNSRNLPPLLNRDVLLTTSAKLNRPGDLGKNIRIFWNGVRETPADFVAPPAAPPRRKKIVYAKTAKTLPADQIKPGAELTMELPELGNSAASGGSKPITATFKFPADFDKDRPYPVILHFGGGTGGSTEALRYEKILAPSMKAIIIGADYNHAENEKRGLLKIGTCRDFDCKIALYALQILDNSAAIDPEVVVLSGFSSGAYSITDNLQGNGWKPFSGFCAIAGGSRTGSPQLGTRPILFVMGQGDTIRHGWLKEAVDGIRGGRPSSLSVVMLENTGHEWNAAVDNTIRDWLSRSFPSLDRKGRFNALIQQAPPEAKAVLEKFRDLGQASE